MYKLWIQVRLNFVKRSTVCAYYERRGATPCKMRVNVRVNWDTCFSFTSCYVSKTIISPVSYLFIPVNSCYRSNYLRKIGVSPWKDGCGRFESIQKQGDVSGIEAFIDSGLPTCILNRRQKSGDLDPKNKSSDLVRKNLSWCTC